MICDHCEEVVVDGVFCTRCGAHQGSTDDTHDHALRYHAYAAHPGEHVGQPSLISTLFPHLSHHKVHEFRWALLVGLGGVFVLWIAGFVTAAILVAAFLIPVLYLIYLYEAQVYRDAPASVVGFTIAAGAVLGIVVTLLSRLFLGDDLLAGRSSAFGLAGSIQVLPLLGLGLVVPVVQEVLKPLPTLWLRGRGFPETMDGVTFGIAAGVGFATAESLVNFSAFIATTDLRTTPGTWILPLITIAMLQPVMHGACSGIVAAALWRLLGRRGGLRDVVGLVAAIVAHVAFAIGGRLLLDGGAGQLSEVIWETAVVLVLLVGVRYQLHRALLEEASDLGMHEAICAHCHRHVVAAGFCPNCGMALAAAPYAIRSYRSSAEPSAAIAAGTGPPQGSPPPSGATDPEDR
ncbi:MAG: PrsW family glutamic-type intramembrane protease [Candidatus Dormibacteraceae bacterium]